LDLIPTTKQWNKSVAPDNTEKSTYIHGRAFRVLVWVETNATSRPQILVRAGDFVGPWEGSFGIGTNAFYVTQNNKTVPAVSGNSSLINCELPEIIALNGDYNASRHSI